LLLQSLARSGSRWAKGASRALRMESCVWKFRKTCGLATCFWCNPPDRLWIEI
jgi:hypothetical protein